MRNMLAGLSHGRVLRVLAFVVVSVVVSLALNAFFGEKVTRILIEQLTGSERYITVTGADGETELRYKLSELPKTQAERSAAAVSALLPSQWQQAPAATQFEQGPNPPDPARVSPQLSASLRGSATAFLQQWETFSPYAQDGYRKRLEPLVGGTARQAVLKRTESVQSTAICAQPICYYGQRYLGGLSGVTLVRSYEGDSAYVTSRGYTRTYDPQGRLAGGEYLREYGLLLQRDRQGHWLVTRAVAQTLPGGSAASG